MFEETRIESKEGFTLSSGRKSGVFYDFGLLKPQQVLTYVEQLAKLLENVKFDFIATPAYGGIIPAFILAGEFGVPYAVLDKTGKLRGKLPESGRYVIIDDVLTSGKAAMEVYKAVRQDNKKRMLVGVYSYIFRGTDADLEQLQQFTKIGYLERKEEEK